MTELLQETWPDPWRLLVACALANLTPGARARPVLERLFARYPTPGALARARPYDIERRIRPLGLQRRRARLLIALSAACERALPASRGEVLAYPGCGQYAADSYAIFVEGDLTVEPTDRVLAAYLAGRRAPRPRTHLPKGLRTLCGKEVAGRGGPLALAERNPSCRVCRAVAGAGV